MDDFGYHTGGQRLLDTGVWVENARTNSKMLTMINLDLTYRDVVPMVTTKKTFWKAAVAEMIGYLKGLTDAQDFADLGANTWFSNANKTQAWLDNPNRKGENHMGTVYGAVGNNFGGINLLEKVYNNLKQGIDDRGEIWTFWKPDQFEQGCLRPCMYSHHFSILGGKLYLNSTQRSADYALGVPFNMVQVHFLHKLMAQITGLELGESYHKMVNVHLYENQVEIFKGQMKRTPLLPSAQMTINPRIKTLEDALNMTVADVTVENYMSHTTIKYPFTA